MLALPAIFTIIHPPQLCFISTASFVESCKYSHLNNGSFPLKNCQSFSCKI